MKVFNLLKNLWQRLKSYSDSNLQTAIDYADTKITGADLQWDNLQTTINIAGGVGSWGSVTVPNDRVLLSPIGIYWYGNYNTNCTNYAFRKASNNTIQFALRNWGSTTATLTVDIQYLYYNVGG